MSIEIGSKSGLLTVVAIIPTKKSPGQIVCKCVCGAEVILRRSYFLRKVVQTCKNCRSGWHSKRATKHGLYGTKTYRAWRSAKSRCQNPNNKQYADYGGRGITMCERWQDFRLFLEDMGEAPLDRSIERVDNSKGYEPDNCVWATRLEQNNNRRGLWKIKIGNSVFSLNAAAREIGISSSTLKDRLKAGDSVFDILCKLEERQWT